jgi:uncharacterized peroxidase-related enzyme
MARLTALNPETTTGKSKDLFDGVQAKLGVVPNIMRTLGNSPAALEAYLNFNGALGNSKIGAKLGELIALTVATLNGCNYCASAHSFIGKNLVKIDEGSISKALNFESIDEKTDAALDFVKILVNKKGNVTNDDVNQLKEAGYSEGEITEITAHTALNIFTNYFNHVADTEIDFPKVDVTQTVHF